MMNSTGYSLDFDEHIKVRDELRNLYDKTDIQVYLGIDRLAVP